MVSFTHSPEHLAKYCHTTMGISASPCLRSGNLDQVSVHSHLLYLDFRWELQVLGCCRGCCLFALIDAWCWLGADASGFGCICGFAKGQSLSVSKESGWLCQTSDEERQEAHESERTQGVKRQRSTRVEVLWRLRWIVQTLGIP